MAEFKCISCGETRESETAGSCPVCGYRMFETPYDRKSVLLSEIKGFFSRLQVTMIIREDLMFEGKEKDADRFPDYAKIQRYVTGSKRTEDFIDRLLETTQQLKRHYTSAFSNIYRVSYENLDGVIGQYDEVLCSAAQLLAPGMTERPEPTKWDKVSLHYSENPNQYLWFSASELLDLIDKLADKIARFIRFNNLYGSISKYNPTLCSVRREEDADFKDELEDAIAATEKVLKKRYVIDIADDGAEELREMLNCLWHNIELIMCAPLFVQSYEFLTEAGRMSEDAFFSCLSAMLQERYERFRTALDLPSLLDGKTEDELFEIYKELIGIDRFGFLVPAGTTLINFGESEKKFNALIGLSGIKESIKKIKAYALANKDSEALNIHMCFLGNPGSGKTEAARCIAGILHENGILPTDKIVEVDRSGLVSQYFGATAEKTSRVIARAMGGVLFIDEAYALGNNADHGTTDYGKEAIDTLVKAMEDHRGKFCVILAGYRNEMQQMLSANPGFKSRIQFTLDFPNYSREELQSIAELMLKERHYTIGSAAMRRILDITDIRRKDPNFANARELRNILDQTIMCQSIRCAGSEDREIGIIDVDEYIRDAKIRLPSSGGGTGGKVLTGEEELDQLVGLSAVKRMIKKVRAYAKRNKSDADFNLHMCFSGNPGTGKTEVARILSRILYDAGVLAEAKLVETDAHGLLGKYVGETAQKAEAVINDAMNGVLFIDEAYSLAGMNAGGGSANYGDEAIAVLLKAMEDRRGQFCVILAGYKDEMKALLDSNPGFASRIQFSLEFPDYTREELGKIANHFMKVKNYEISEEALKLLLDVAEYYRKRPNFANARTIRNIADQVILNQNLRAEDDAEDRLIVESDVKDYILDEGIDLSAAAPMRRIGF